MSGSPLAPLANSESLMSTPPLARQLRAFAAFRALPEAALLRLYGHGHALALGSGETLAHAGAPLRGLYIVVSGRLLSVADSLAPEPGERSFYAGAAIYPLAFLAGRPAPAHVLAARPSVVFCMEREALDEAARDIPEFWPSLTAGLAGELLALGHERTATRAPAKSLFICAAGPEPLAPLVLDRMLTALEARARCQVLSAQALGQDLPGGIALDDPQVMHWLDEQERASDLVIYLAGSEADGWTRRALAHADQALMIGMHDADASGPRMLLNPVEELVLETLGSANCRLALVHAGGRAGEPIPGAERWIDPRGPRSWHHVALNDGATYDRLARFVLGRANGVFLTGPGLAGAAALGIVRALQAFGVPVDAICGTGAGAAVGALLGLGLGADDADALSLRVFAEAGVLREGRARASPGGERIALYDHKRLDSQIARHIPPANIPDLAIPFCAVSANLSSGQPYWHVRGGIQAVSRANWLPPGAVAPFITPDRDMLVDGSGLSPLPLDSLRDLGLGSCFIIAPVLAPLGPAPLRYQDLPAGYTLPWIWPQDDTREGQAQGRLPGMADIVARARSPLALGVDGHGDTLMPGVGVIPLFPPMPRGVSVLDWQHHSKVMALAYAWGMRELTRAEADGDPFLAAARDTV
jgi:NTE family protein